MDLLWDVLGDVIRGLTYLLVGVAALYLLFKLPGGGGGGDWGGNGGE